MRPTSQAKACTEHCTVQRSLGFLNMLSGISYEFLVHVLTAGDLPHSQNGVFNFESVLLGCKCYDLLNLFSLTYFCGKRAIFSPLVRQTYVPPS